MHTHAHATRATVPAASPMRATVPPARAAPAIRQVLHAPAPQAKLTLGAPKDAFEQEADRVADHVMRMPEPGVQRQCAACAAEEESAATIRAKAAGETIQRAVRFQAEFSNISLAARQAAAISGQSFTYQDASFSADADINAVGDTEAELNDWDVGVLQDIVVNWEREYWLRENTDGRGRFVEQKFRPIFTRMRDQASGAATVWTADSEHQLVSGLAKTPRAGGGFECATTITTSDDPGGSDRRDGEDVTGMDASDGERNIRTQRIGSRFDTWISAHNTVTDEWRHLRRLNWNYMRSLDFTGTGATLAVGPETGQVGRHGPHGPGKDAPLTSGTTANDAVADDANWTRRRVDGWT